MKTLALAPLLVAVLVSAETPAPPRPAMTELAFLAGSWETETDGVRVEEQWTCPGPDAMYATGRTIAHGKTVFFEFLRIESRADAIYYVAQPKGKPPTDFRLVRKDGETWVFENPAHDFPKRILYTKTGDDSLVARVEGDASSKEKAEEFRYRRSPGSSARCR